MEKEKLIANHARFCAKYVRFFGFATTKRQGFYQSILKVDNQNAFEFIHSKETFEVGEKVYIAKRVPSHHGELQTWSIHEIILPETYWNYSYHFDQKTKYTPHVQTHFKRDTFVVLRVK